LAGIDTTSIIQRINKLKVEYDKLMKNPQPSKVIPNFIFTKFNYEIFIILIFVIL